MAHLEYINITGVGNRIGINLSQSVGLGQANIPQDVAAVQALFRILAKGMGSEAVVIKQVPVPEVSGQYDGLTHLAVMRYQQRWRNRLLTGKNADHCFHPASYYGRIIRNPRKPLMAITLLHIQAAFGSWDHMDGYDYVGFLKFRLSPWGALNFRSHIRFPFLRRSAGDMLGG